MDSFISLILSEYGPVAFGLVAVIILWKVIVDPSLKSSEIYTKVMQQSIVELKEIASINNESVKLVKELVHEIREVRNEERRHVDNR